LEIVAIHPDSVVSIWFRPQGAAKPPAMLRPHLVNDN
jgi:hypothetical protein